MAFWCRFVSSKHGKLRVNCRDRLDSTNNDQQQCCWGLTLHLFHQGCNHVWGSTHVTTTYRNWFYCRNGLLEWLWVLNQEITPNLCFLSWDHWNLLILPNTWLLCWCIVITWRFPIRLLITLKGYKMFIIMQHETVLGCMPCSSSSSRLTIPNETNKIFRQSTKHDNWYK